MNFRVETIAIGDELLTGQISDTNSTFVAARLRQEGMLLHQTNVVLDRKEEIHTAIREASKRADVVICFGGLGPTSDDLTAPAVAELINSPLEIHKESEARLLAYLAERGRKLTPESHKQCQYPKLATPYPNPKGMATGFYLTFGKAVFFFLPGVPLEMKAMFEASVLPVIREKREAQGASKLFSVVWRLYQIPESELQRLMNPIEAQLPKGAYLGYRTNPPENYLTLYSETPLQTVAAQIREIVKPFTFEEGDRTVEQVVLDELRKKKLVLGLAESCTGGAVAARLTAVGGGSDVFWGSFVTYQVAAKQRALGVDVETDEGAVSACCSKELAEKTQGKSGASITAAITGYLGPTGGTEQDPVGTIYLCVLGPKTIESRIVMPVKDREAGMKQASTHLFHHILKAIA